MRGSPRCSSPTAAPKPHPPHELARMSNDLPLGRAVPGWTSRPRPPRAAMLGRFCRLEPLSAELHADSLFDANALDREERMWTYLLQGPYGSRAEYRATWSNARRARTRSSSRSSMRASSARPGWDRYLRIEPAHGVIEVGHLAFSPLLQRTAGGDRGDVPDDAAGLRARLSALRMEVRRAQCAARVAPRSASGFTFEGIFRQAVVYKGRNRDTAWYAIIDSDWPALDARVPSLACPG